MSNFKPIGRNRKFIRQESPKKIFTQMTSDHADVLQNIEFSIVSAYRCNNNIDDKVVASALRTAITGGDAADELSHSLIEALEDIRLLCADVSDEIWKKGLKVVLQSVYDHSDMRTGDRDYLEFVSPFLP